MESRNGRILLYAVMTALAASALSRSTQRARGLGVPFDSAPGPLNVIIDVAGVEVLQTTLISGNGPLKVGDGPVTNPLFDIQGR